MTTDDSQKLTSESVSYSRPSVWYESWKDKTPVTHFITLSSSFCRWIEYGEPENSCNSHESCSSDDDDEENMPSTIAELAAYAEKQGKKYLESGQSLSLSSSDSDDEVCEGNDIRYVREHFPSDYSNLEKYFNSSSKQYIAKLEWSVPIDSKWITGELIAFNLSDLIRQLRASQRVGQSISTMRNIQNSSPTNKDNDNAACVLSLRETLSFDEAFEFRCFFSNGRMIAACQRDCKQFFSLSDLQKENCFSYLSSNFNDVSSRLQASPLLDHCMIDIVLIPLTDVKTCSSFSCKVFDVCHWYGASDPLLFEWSELESFKFDDFSLDKIRYICSQEEKHAYTLQLEALPIEMQVLSKSVNEAKMHE